MSDPKNTNQAGNLPSPADLFPFKKPEVNKPVPPVIPPHFGETAASE